jgi:hypothetical protein
MASLFCVPVRPALFSRTNCWVPHEIFGELISEH